MQGKELTYAITFRWLNFVCNALLCLGQMKNETSAQNNVEQELKRLEKEWLNSYPPGRAYSFGSRAPAL
jgi:hypothetical protein